VDASLDQFKKIPGLQIYGISSQDPIEAALLQRKLGLHFRLIGCPDYKLAIYLHDMGFVDVYEPLIMYPGGDSDENSTSTDEHKRCHGRSCIQPGILITTRHRILFSWAAEVNQGFDLGFKSTSKNDDWPSIESIIDVVNDELADDSPHRLTPTSETIRKKTLLEIILGGGSGNVGNISQPSSSLPLVDHLHQTADLDADIRESEADITPNRRGTVSGVDTDEGYSCIIS
jgi:hypothetical protein